LNEMKMKSWNCLCEILELFDLGIVCVKKFHVFIFLFVSCRMLIINSNTSQPRANFLSLS